jgi:hypothetical protein
MVIARREDSDHHFLAATAMFDGRSILSEPSPRADEKRWLNIGELHGQLTMYPQVCT